MLRLQEGESVHVRSGSFVLDCIRMTLRPRVAGARQQFEGAGVIRQDDRGTLIFTLYDPQYQPGLDDLHQHLNDWGSPGEFFPVEEFYDLEAIDLQGRTWRAQSILPSTSARLGTPGLIATGRLQEISSSSADEVQGHWLKLFVPGDIHIFTNSITETVVTSAGRTARKGTRNVWIPANLAFKLVMEMTDLGLELETYSDRELPPEFATRLEEALWLVLGLPAAWLVLEERKFDSSRVSIRSRRDKPVPRLRPPIEPSKVEAAEDAARLLDAYLRYTCTYDSNRYHPLAVNIRNVLRASAGTIQDEALALGVAVETTLREFFAADGSPGEDVVRAADHAENLIIAGWHGRQDLLERIRTSIGLLRGSNPGIALRNLAARGIVLQAHVDAWARVRHRAAHGLDHGPDYQELIRSCDRVHQLLLLL